MLLIRTIWPPEAASASQPALVSAMTALRLMSMTCCQWCGVTSGAGAFSKTPAAVNDHIDPTEGGKGLFNHSLRFAGLGEVCCQCCGRAVKSSGCGLQPILPASHQHAARAPIRQGGGTGPSDAGSAAGDDRDRCRISARHRAHVRNEAVSTSVLIRPALKVRPLDRLVRWISAGECRSIGIS